MPLNATPDRLIEFRTATIGTTIVLMRDTNPPRLADDLHKMLGGMPDFFSGEAAILDLSALADTPERIDWVGLLSLWRRFQLQPIGVCNVPPALLAGARQAGLAVLDHAEESAPRSLPQPPHQPPQPEPAPQPPPAKQAAPEPLAPAPALPTSSVKNTTLIIERPVRSGQQVYAQGGDLVLLAGMSNGAEVIADGSIHCYGPLRGRALAGAQGNASARIIATNFGPEIVSINGVYKTFEQGVSAALANKPAHVRLSGSGNEQKLNIEPLQLD